MTAFSHSLGIFGGTFNPIHLGHIETVQQGAKLLNLQSIALLPANIPPHKALPDISNHHRIAMLALICHKNELFYLDKQELESDNTSYTVNTLEKIKANAPQQSIYFFIGMDSLVHFHQWYQYQKILSLTNLVVSTRPGYQLEKIAPDIKQHLIDYKDYLQLTADSSDAGHIILLPEIQHEIASSDIRQRVCEGLTISHLVPPSIEQYIHKHQLYRNSDK